MIGYGNNPYAMSGYSGLPSPYGSSRMRPNGPMPWGPQIAREGAEAGGASGAAGAMPGEQTRDMKMGMFPGFGGFNPMGFGGFMPYGGFPSFGGFNPWGGFAQMMKQQQALPMPGAAQPSPAASPSPTPPPTLPPPSPPPTTPTAGGSGSGPPDSTRTYWDGMTWRAPT